MGAPAIILKMRNLLKSTIESDRVRYFTTNSLRNPFKDVELYILPMGIATISWVAAVVVDKTCMITNKYKIYIIYIIYIYLFMIYINV